MTDSKMGNCPECGGVLEINFREGIDRIREVEEA